uniref:Uncharacterized protein n=1 Tax=Bartonella schoenbuchensis (strain DSM 13525 / NCTC 13165 / R1) TaxID=687861 RepID=E6YZN1_BARSR|nr:hypothetical protein B11C_40174 [Bartonella schoenbuchensis R1]
MKNKKILRCEIEKILHQLYEAEIGNYLNAALYFEGNLFINFKISDI